MKDFMITVGVLIVGFLIIAKLLKWLSDEIDAIYDDYYSIERVKERVERRKKNELH